MNLGTIDMCRVWDLARLAGISRDELDQELADRNLTGLAFTAS